VRILLAIVDHGDSRSEMVRRIIREYRSFPHDVRIVIMRDVPTAVEYGVEVVVGTPTKNPWTLTFAHRKLFTKCRNEYDIFIYSENDVLCTAAQFEKWLDLNELLPNNIVPGFILFEEDDALDRSYPMFQSHFHWKTDSVVMYGNEVFGSYSNMHSAFYILDRAALGVALGSGQFDVSPYRGRFGLAETACAGVFTDCEVGSALALRSIEDLAVHHMPNDYVGIFGIDSRTLERQCSACISIYEGRRDQGQLFPTVARSMDSTYDKRFAEEPSEALLAAVPSEAVNVLSVGVGMGELEKCLREDGHEVTCIPLDAIMQAQLESLGFVATAPDLGRAIDQLGGQKFDALVLSNVLNHVADPQRWIRGLSVLAPGAIIAASTMEFRSYRARTLFQAVRKVFGLRHHKSALLSAPPRGPYEETLLHSSGRRWLTKLMLSSGVEDLSVVREQERPRLSRPDTDHVPLANRIIPSHVVVAGRITER